MESISQMLDTCSLPEKMQLLEYAKVKNSAGTKKLMLMKLFVNQPELSDSEYAQKIYKKPETAAYFQLKKRVKDEFEELFMLLKPNCLKKETQLHIECSELLLKSQHILARGIRAEGSKLLERGLKMAIKHGFHDLVLTIYSTAKRFGLYEVLSNNDLPELEIAIRSHLRLLITKNQVKEDDPPQAKNHHLKTMIRQLSFSRNSWSKLDLINKSIRDGKYKTAMAQVTQAESEWDQNTESKTKDELLIAKMSILLAQRKFPKVLAVCNESQNTSDFSPENALKHSLIHWHSLFHQNKLDDAQLILKRKLMNLGSQQCPSCAYLMAYVDFKQQSFKAALKQIHSCQKDLKNKLDYYLGSKMLELMILFDQNDQDWLEYKIENFRKLVSRKKGKINTRIDYAFQLFSKLQKSMHKPECIDLTLDPLFIKLQNEKGDLAWHPHSFELIRYDSWILSLLKRQNS
ncbi:hypothetical protein [Algoriphagus chordae]|uniref:Uncharacterized protein n=1 Tax=Algoriphagus chordae TaxID=237019 RepID=A0A2W7RGN0_9BACT|nr:hypothetical protein [Algoriphagus chordae]PZX49885.1 hypothetical protein LV85_02948 [Algoriphagus chordae]